MTREEMLALMKSGSLNAFPTSGAATADPAAGPPRRPATAWRPVLRPGRPVAAPRSVPVCLARRPAPGPGMPRRRPLPPMTTEEEEDKKGKTGRLGSAADRAGRRARRSERAVDRRVTSPVPAAALLADDEDTRRTRSGIKKSRGGQRIGGRPIAQVARRDRTADHRSQPLPGDRRQGQRPDPQADGNEPARHHQRLARRRGGDHARPRVRHRARGRSRAHRRRRPARLVRVLRHVGEPRASAPGHHDPGPRRPRQDLAPGPHSQVERRRFRERRHHPAHRRLPGRVQRPPDHVRRHARPRSVHLDACPRRQRHRHRRPGRRRRRRRDAPDRRGHRPRQGGRRADRGGAQQDRLAQRRHAVQHQQDLRRALAAGLEPGRMGRRHRGRQDLGVDRPGHSRPAGHARDDRRAARAEGRPDPAGDRHLPGGLALRGPRRGGLRAGPGRDPAASAT